MNKKEKILWSIIIIIDALAAIMSFRAGRIYSGLLWTVLTLVWTLMIFSEP